MFSIVAYWFVNHHFLENPKKEKKAILIKFKITTNYKPYFPPRNIKFGLGDLEFILIVWGFLGPNIL